MPEEPYAESAAESADQDLIGWRIIAESTGGNDLHDCLIIEVAAGPPAEYKFADPKFKTLSTSTLFPPVFKDFEYMNQKWTVSVRTDLLDDPKFAFGNWSKPDTPGAANDPGDWTAQSGIGPVGAKAASADAS